MTALLDTLGRRNRKHADKACKECGMTFRPKRADSRYCSRPCMWANNGGHNRKEEVWWINSKGYIEGRVRMPDGSVKRFKKHRHLMEKLLGRTLAAWEDVHHKDGNKLNNDLSNLVIMGHSEHSVLTNLARWAAKAEGTSSHS